MPGIGDALPVGPPAGRGHFDVDERADHVAPVAERHRFPDVGQELEFAFEQPGRERRAVVQRADIGHAVDDPQLPVRAEVAGVAGVKPAVGVLCLRRCARGRRGIP